MDSLIFQLKIPYLINLFCSVVTCQPNYGYPSDPLNSSRLEPPLIQRDVDPIVRTRNGLVEGWVMRSIRGREIYAFEGIPFAEPPIGMNRFRAPISKKSWDGILKVQNSTSFCTQVNILRFSRVIGQEDCLYLNLYTPQLPSDSNKEHKLLPILIWIHGGAFSYGGGSEYGPSYLLERDLILVTINYRLGVFGFLSTGDPTAPGNNGLKDQALAIKWVYKNGRSFGGDPRRITLGGQSAGAVSVHLHMMSTRVASRKKIYFRNAISLSGSAFSSWGLQPKWLAIKRTERFAKGVGCPFIPGMVNTSQLLLDCLRQLPAEDLAASQKLVLDKTPAYPPVYFGPTVESDGIPGSFLTISPLEAYTFNRVARIPWIGGLTKDEGDFALILMKGLNRLHIVRRHWEERQSLYLDYRNILGDKEEAITGVSSKIQAFYFGEPENPANATLETISQIHSDRYFNYGMYKAIKEHSKIAPTYASVFGYKGRFGLEKQFFNLESTEKWGVGHSEDIFYFLNSSYFSPGLKTIDAEYAVTQFMVNLIHNFCSKNKPLYSVVDGLEGWSKDKRIWKEVGNPIRFLSIDNLVEMKPFSEGFLRRMKFWGDLNLPDMLPI